MTNTDDLKIWNVVIEIKKCLFYYILYMHFENL